MLLLSEFEVYGAECYGTTGSYGDLVLQSTSRSQVEVGDSFEVSKQQEQPGVSRRSSCVPKRVHVAG